MGASSSSPTHPDPVTSDAPLKMFTMQDIKAHKSRDSAWLVIDGSVYDATSFIDMHPGGAATLLGSSGMDASDDFNSFHSDDARAILKKYYIGKLVTAPPPLVAEAATTVGSLSLTVLKPDEKVMLKLVSKRSTSKNAIVLRFSLPPPSPSSSDPCSEPQRLGLPVGNHVYCYSPSIEGELVMRPFTPISSDTDPFLELAVKVYRPTPAHPTGGKMGQLLDALSIGDEIGFKGPVGHFSFHPDGTYIHRGIKGVAKKLSCIAGGSGITPIFAVIKAALGDATSHVEIRLLYANQNQEEILLREELDDMIRSFPRRLSVRHILSRPLEGWTGDKGRVDREIMQSFLFPAESVALALACGPKGLVDEVSVPGFTALGYSISSLVIF